MIISDNGSHFALTKAGMINKKLSKGQLELYKIRFGLDGPDDVELITKYMFSEDIKTSIISPDGRYWASSGKESSKLYIWPFEEMTSKISINNLQNYRLDHRHPVSLFFFRRNLAN